MRVNVLGTIKKAKGPRVTFDEVGAPARLSGGPSAATNIPVVHTLLMVIQSTFYL